MKINFFQLSKKCSFSCLNCTILAADKKEKIIKKINESKKNTLNIFYNLTIDNQDFPIIKKTIEENQQKIGFFYNGLPEEEYLKYTPYLIAFPMFSTENEKHNLFIGKQNFYSMISLFNSLPRKIKKPIVFFVTKENISETTDLKGLNLSLKTNFYIQPLSFYEEPQFDKETLLYLKRISKNKKIKLLIIGKSPTHCKNWNPQTNLLKETFHFFDQFF